MASVTKPARQPSGSPEPAADFPPLEPGDRLDQPTFHARYEAMPEGFRAELIGGVVHMPSPLKRRHGKTHARVSYWVTGYALATPGTEVFDSATTILGPESEPQPDLCLLISASNLGQTSDKDDYIVGPPELIIEIAYSTESIGLFGKKLDYEALGVREYLVVALRQQKMFWFISRQRRFEEMAAASDGTLRSETFPGLWLDPTPLLAGDMPQVLSVLRQGLATPEHAAFVAKLAGK